MVKKFNPIETARIWRRNGFSINRAAREMGISRQTVSYYLREYFVSIRAEKIVIDKNRHVVLIPLKHWPECCAKLFPNEEVK